jgi:hypothetical protein
MEAANDTVRAAKRIAPLGVVLRRDADKRLL